ncbi:MAG: enoyl-CoA hydratase/isomerase family protein [Bradymonadales bacterium]|nr:enoyl-CoA hydratase/isomerase family protein [Bradymonadales bacterium]
MSEPELLYSAKDGIAWMTINREARRNALNQTVIDLFDEYLDRVEADSEIRVVCITGAGDKAFCSGADLMGGLGGSPGQSTLRAYAHLLQRMVGYSRPLVARVNGHCVAGGLGLLLACDIAYARQGIQVGTPEVKVGLFPMMIAALILQNATRKKAVEMLFTGRMLSAEQAESMGLLTAVFPADELDQAVSESLRCIASRAPVALRMGKQALAEVDGLRLGQALSYLCDRLEELIETEDAAEGLAAFAQKREPRWKGR